MTRERSEKNFVCTLLPWIAAGGGLLLYLLTLNHWINFSSLAAISKITGWDWRHSYTGPGFYVITLPLILLPIWNKPIAFNLFSAVCGALTLALLARSIALMPHDRTRDQRQREPAAHFLLSLPHAWLPPLLAVLVCALQLTFWEHATVATGEMLDLL